jgi:hypothetical protein
MQQLPLILLKINKYMRLQAVNLPEDGRKIKKKKVPE